MLRGRKPAPRAHALKSIRLGALPRCPAHLSEVAHKEWRRLATPLHEAGILTLADRAALAAYCQAWSRWVEAETRLAETPPLLKTPSGYVQQSPWLAVANKQLELMGRYMSELGLTPAARARLQIGSDLRGSDQVTSIEVVSVYRDENGNLVRESMGGRNLGTGTEAPDRVRIRIGGDDP